MSAIDKLHDKARRAVESGESKFREAAECLAEAQKLGATQRQSAKAIGKSPAWVNALLKWRRGGYGDRCPFPRAKRRVQPAEQKGPTPRLPRSADDAQAVIAKANADTVKWEARKVEAEARKRAADQAIMSFGGIAADVHRQLVQALEERDYERAERIRASLRMAWHQLIIPGVEARSAA
jgi:hypothetical protein